METLILLHVHLQTLLRGYSSETLLFSVFSSKNAVEFQQLTTVLVPHLTFFHSLADMLVSSVQPAVS